MENEDFIKVRDELKAYVTNKKLVSAIFDACSAKSRSSIYETFAVGSEAELVGLKLEIWNTAIAVVAKAKTAVSRASAVLKE